MRNLFDQYDQWENRVTHALMSSLAADSWLLRAFLRDVVEVTPPRRSPLAVTVQQLPGEPTVEEVDAERRGIPDAWIHDGDQWCVVIESKVALSATTDQLRRHQRMAARIGYDRAHLLVLTVRPYVPPPSFQATVRTWQDIYVWLRRHARRSPWALRAAEYLEAAERRMIKTGYLKEGTMTTFAGIPFGPDQPYNYPEAKRLLKITMEGLRADQRLRKRLRADLTGDGRTAITGRDSTTVWDYISLVDAKGGDFTRYPHLTMAIQSDRVLTITTVPNRITPAFRRNLKALGEEGFADLLQVVERNMRPLLRKAPGAAPWFRAVQRHYPTQRSAPVDDAVLEFDLRTLRAGRAKGAGTGVKAQPQWGQAAFRAWSEKRSNMPLELGAIFPYRSCSALRESGAIRLFSDTWLACQPFLDAVLGR